jgi:hypothetical protein
VSDRQKQITWFANSPDAGDPTCICSWCSGAIGVSDAPIIRLFDSDANTEARFHRRCLRDSGVLPGVSFPEDELTSGFDGAQDAMSQTNRDPLS